MPISYWIAPIRRLVLVCGEGTIADWEAMDLCDALGTDPRFQPSFRGLVDHSRAVDVLLPNGLGGIQALNPYGQGSRRAVIAPTDAVYGTIRMYQMGRPPAADEVQVFRRRQPALQWLGIDDSDLPVGEPDWQSSVRFHA